MDVKFNSVSINQFRGLKNITLDKCSKINMIVGDNNGGKTSILEAVAILGSNNPRDLLRISRFRRLNYARINDFLYLFPNKTDEISIDAATNEGPISIKADYSVEELFISDLEKNEKRIMKYGRLSENGVFHRFSIRLNRNRNRLSFEFDDTNQFIFGGLPTRNQTNRIVYVSPFEHFNVSTFEFSSIAKNSEYKEIFIELLKLFDKEIEDVMLLENDPYGSRDLYIKKFGCDPTPVSSYGDGTKKAISLAMNIVGARNGVLLLDEIETSLHHSYFDDIFRFLLKTATHFNVQVFVTTHSSETIRALLNINAENKEDMIRIYTTRRNNQGNTKIRSLNGLEALSYIVDSKIEVRD